MTEQVLATVELDMTEGTAKAKSLNLSNGQQVICIMVPVNMDDPRESSTGKTLLAGTMAMAANAWDTDIRITANVMIPLKKKKASI